MDPFQIPAVIKLCSYFSWIIVVIFCFLRNALTGSSYFLFIKTHYIDKGLDPLFFPLIDCILLRFTHLNILNVTQPESLRAGKPQHKLRKYNYGPNKKYFT